MNGNIGGRVHQAREHTFGQWTAKEKSMAFRTMWLGPERGRCIPHVRLCLQSGHCGRRNRTDKQSAALALRVANACWTNLGSDVCGGTAEGPPNIGARRCGNG